MNIRLALAIIALLAVVAVSSWFLYREDIRQVLAPPPSDLPDYQLDDFTYQSNDKQGQPKYTLKGGHMEHYPDSERYVIDGVEIKTYSGDRLLWRTEAKQAIIHDPTRTIFLKGETLVYYYSEVGKEPTVLVSSDVTVYTDDNTAESSQPTRVTYTQGTVTSKNGFRIDGESRNLTMLGDVSGEIKHD